MTTATKVKWRAPGNYDTKEASDEAAADCSTWGPSLTVQSMAEETDLNVIMKRFGITGKFPENPRVPTYGDFTGISDYRTALHAIRDADDAFMEYPADLRQRFDNDPQKFLDFCSQETNREEMRKMGLLKEPTTIGQPAGAPIETPPATPVAAPPSGESGKTT